MKNLTTKSFLTGLLTVAMAAGAFAANDFYKNNRKGDRDPNKLYPQGNIFPFTGYSMPATTGMKTLGFTASGPTYGKSQSKLADASAKDGLLNVWQLHATYDGIVINGKEALGKAAKAAGKAGIDWVKMGKCYEDAVKSIIEKHGDTIAWWALGVEEVRWWNKNEMKIIEVAYKAIKNADPQKRPMWIYMPGHYGASGMRKYMPYMDMLAQGYYPNFGNRAGYRYWCENVQKTVEGLKPERPMIAVTEMFRDPQTDEDHNLIGAFVRHDVWMALIHKFKGIVVFSFGNRRNFDTYGTYFYHYSEVAREITREGGLGDVVLFGEDMNDLSLKVVEGPEQVTIQRTVNKKKVAFNYTSLKWRDMRHSQGRYFFAASSSKTPIQAQLTGLPKEPVKVINAANNEVLGTTSNGTFMLNFGPHGVNLLKFEKAE